MKIKKILVIGPHLPRWKEIQHIAESLDFLTPKYQLFFFDPLECLSCVVTEKDFLKYWSHKLAELVTQYDCFFGFSIGGIILQQNFSLFEQQNHNKKIILFSTPSFIDDLLFKRLSAVVKLAKEQSLAIAIDYFNHYVFYPAIPPIQNEPDDNADVPATRFIRGLQFVLAINSRNILQTTKVSYLHLMGEQSKLVNHNNVIQSLNGQLLKVPHAGMRVLQNNLAFCSEPIRQFLEGK